MLSLSRRKASLNKTTEGNGPPQLPDDILILVCTQCRIDELLALRLASTHTRNLIDEYTSTIVPSVARTTFPYSDVLLGQLDDRSQCTLRWLVGLVPRQLAAILVERHRLFIRYGIPAEDAFGDELRARVANGWHVLRRLANISRDVHGATAKSTPKSPIDMAQKLILPSRFRLEASKRREDLVLQRRLEYLDSLTDQTAKDYKLMMILLSSAFSTSTANVGSAHDPWVFDWGGGIDGQRAFRQGKSWLAWFVLTEGPDLFWSQWWSLPPASAQNYIRDRATTAFKALPAALADHQRLLAQKFQDALHEKALHTDFDGSNPYPYSAHLRGGRPEQADHEPFRETMGHVPFLVNFRCPEELVKRTELLLEGRAASRTTQGLVSREA